MPGSIFAAHVLLSQLVFCSSKNGGGDPRRFLRSDTRTATISSLWQNVPGRNARDWSTRLASDVNASKNIAALEARTVLDQGESEGGERCYYRRMGSQRTVVVPMNCVFRMLLRRPLSEFE